MGWHGPSYSRARRLDFRVVPVLAALSIVGLTETGGLCATAADEPVYHVQDLGTLGGSFSRAYAINKAGWVVGESETEDGRIRAFLWTPERGMVPLGAPDGLATRAFAVNDMGDAAGEAEIGEGRFAPLVWTREGAVRRLSMPDGLRDGFVHAINNFGVMAGGAEGPRGPRAVIWRLDEPAIPKPVVEFPASAAHAVNDLGLVAGRLTLNRKDPEGNVPFFVQADAVTDGWKSFRRAICSGAVLGLNSEGMAVGFAVISGVVRAARFLPPYESPELLDTLNSAYSLAYAVNARGEAVGSFAAGPEEDDRAFVHVGGEMRDLNELVEVDETWKLSEARGINEAGRIAATALVRGRDRAVLLTPIGRRPARPRVRLELLTSVPDESDSGRAERRTTVLEAMLDPPTAAVRRVLFYANGEIIGASTSAPYRIEWRRPPAGDQHLMAVVVTSEGRRRSPRLAIPAD